MKPPVFLTLAELSEIHRKSLEDFGGRDGLRDRGLLESALAIPHAGFGKAFLHDSLPEMAAAYAFHIAQNQPFIDGNKRTALAAALLFLRMNDRDLDDPKDELYDAMIAISERRMTKSELAEIFKKLIK